MNHAQKPKREFLVRGVYAQAILENRLRDPLGLDRNKTVAKRNLLKKENKEAIKPMNFSNSQEDGYGVVTRL